MGVKWGEEGGEKQWAKADEVGGGARDSLVQDRADSRNREGLEESELQGDA